VFLHQDCKARRRSRTTGPTENHLGPGVPWRKQRSFLIKLRGRRAKEADWIVYNNLCFLRVSELLSKAEEGMAVVGLILSIVEGFFRYWLRNHSRWLCGSLQVGGCLVVVPYLFPQEFTLGMGVTV
jgi:hypothetical protein